MALTFYTDCNGFQLMDPPDVDNPLTFYSAPSSGNNFNIWSFLTIFLLDENVEQHPS